MNIQTKIRIGTVATIALMLTCVGTIALFASVIRDAYDRQRTIEAIAERSFQLAQLRSEYVQYHGERPKSQWISLHNSQERLFVEHATRFTEKREQPLFNDIVRISADVETLFEELVRSVDQGDRETVVQELNNQLNIKSQLGITKALDLATLSRERVSRASASFVLAVIILGILVCGISVGSYVVNASAIRSLRTLKENAGAIAQGYLDRRIAIRSADEAGALASAFNLMATKLQESHADLEAKIAAKTRELAQKVSETEEKNISLERAQKAMLNVSEDLEAVNKELEAEVLNVRKFQQAVDASTEAIAITLPAMTYVYVNPAWTNLTGYAFDEVKGETPRLLMSEKTTNALREQFMASVQGNEEEGAVFQSDAIVQKKKDGSEYDAEIVKYSIKDGDSVVFYVVIHRDITQRKRSELAKSEFVTLASHQLRTPLTEIRWALSTLKRERLGEKRAKLIDAAHKGSVHMAETINAMLMVSRIDTRDIAPLFQPVHVAETFGNVIELHAAHCKKKHLTVETSCPANALMHTDEHLLKEVLSNLLGNACKYSQQDGTIRIRVADLDGRIRIEMEDSGCGIPLGDQSRIFERFFRGSNVIGREESGSGIGLYIVRSLMTLLGGTITFESQENRGTLFILTFPQHT